MPVDTSIQTVLQQHTLVTIAGWDHAAVHEVELNELSIGQVQIHRHQLSTTALYSTWGQLTYSRDVWRYVFDKITSIGHFASIA